MQGKPSKKVFRVLIADDEEHILESIRTILIPAEPVDKKNLDDLEVKLFGRERHEEPALPLFDVVACLQGKDAVEAVKKAFSVKKPFSVVFLDMRMPPGQDGLWTAEQIRELDPMVNIVITTAYSDIDPKEIAAKVGPRDKLLYIQKPFHSHEIQQLAISLGAKWWSETQLLDTTRSLEEKVKERTSELATAMSVLKEEIEIRKIAEEAQQKAEAGLQQKAIDLEATNTALQVLFRQKNEERKAIEAKIVFNIREMVLPYVEKLQHTELAEIQQNLVEILEKNLKGILTPFLHQMSQKFFRLTPNEINIVNLIKQGKKTREIAILMGMAKRTVDFHRDKIRLKIGIKNKKANLKAILQQFDLDTNWD